MTIEDTRQNTATRHAALSEVVLRIAETSDLQRLLDEFVGEVRRILDFDRCTLAMIESDQQTYQLQTLLETRSDRPAVVEGSIPLSRGLFVGLLSGIPDLDDQLAKASGRRVDRVLPALVAQMKNASSQRMRPRGFR